MFPSDNNNDNPFDILLKRSSFLCDPNPSSRQDDPPFFLNFPSPFFDENELPLNQILSQNQVMDVNYQYLVNNTDSTENETKCNIEVPKLKEKASDQPISGGIVTPLMRRRNLGVIPRKRTGKKDRHSKICTAQGIRDRRMRLSLQIARKFFDLQDMLGYDKASKTIEWLFTKSKKAIKELTRYHSQGNNISISDAKSESLLSEVSEIEYSNSEIKEGIIIASTSIIPLCINPFVKDEIKSQKLACRSHIREARDKARARARCRTREKMMIKLGLENLSQWNKLSPNENNDFLKLGFQDSPLEGVDQESSSKNQEITVSPYIGDYSPIGHQLADVGTIEKLLGNSSTSKPCPISDSGCVDPNSHFMGFLGNWDQFLNSDSRTQYSVTNQDSLSGNPKSIYSAPPTFPSFHQ